MKSVRRSKSPPTLRERVEAAVRVTRQDIARMAAEEIQRTVHELQVHQIELEMQNEELRTAQTELGLSRDRFNDLYDTAPVGYLTLDPEGSVIEANLTVARMLGIERKKLVGRKFSRFLARRAHDTFYFHQRAVLAADTKQICELELRGPEGTTFAARMESIGLADSPSGTRYCRSVIIDVTERKQAEEALARSHAELEQRVIERTAELRESERTARAVVNGLSAHLAIADERGCILAVNVRWRIFAQENGASEVVICEGANYLAACDAAARRRSPGAAAVAVGIRQVLSGKSPEFSVEYPCHSATEERWFIMRVTPFPGDGPRRVVISHENITARVKAEQGVRQEKEFSDRVIDTVQTIVLLLSPQGRILQFNRHLEELSGWSIHEVRGRSWFDVFLPARGRARIRKLFPSSLRGRRAQANVSPIVTKDGRELEIEWHNALFHDPDGHLVGLLCSGRDITTRKLAETALQSSREQYRQLIHALPAAVYTCDTQGRITLYNAAAVALWGREPSPRDRWHGAHRLLTADGKRLPLEQTPMALSVRQDEPIRGSELIIERPDSTVSHVLAFPDPVHDSADAVIGAVNMLVDITALKVAENALRTSERSLRTLSRAIEQSPASVLITNTSGAIDYVNPKFTEVTGYTTGDVLGKNLRLLRSSHQPPGLFREMWTTVTAGRVWRSELCNQKKNGELFWVYAVIAPIQDEHGTITHFVELMEDISSRKLAEKALAESKHRLAGIVGSAMDAIISVDARQRIVLFNAAAETMFRCPADEAIGSPINRFIPQRFQAAHAEHLRRLSEGKTTNRPLGPMSDISAVRANGEEFPIEASISQIEVGGQRIFTVILRDITERRRLEKEVLEISAREQRRIGQELHDDICQWLAGTELSAGALALDLAEESPGLAARARKLAEGMRQSLARARTLARGLAPTVIESEGLARALRELAANAGDIFAIHCTYEGPENLRMRDEVAALHLYRIAQEAITNAVRHGGARAVGIFVQRQKDRISMLIRDDGCGLPEPLPSAPGMGLRTMRYRAGVIGATLKIHPGSHGGTEIVCTFPREL